MSKDTSAVPAAHIQRYLVDPERDDLAVLVLEDGFTLVGQAYGERGRTLGEIVFSTAMTGYQETFTDPSYHRQIVVMTAPHIGNVGVNATDAESDRIWVAGLAIREPSPAASSWRAEGELEDYLKEHGVVGISGIDTRALTLHLRSAGVMRAGIFSGSSLPSGIEHLAAHTIDVLTEVVRSAPLMSGADLAGEVTTEQAYVIEPEGGVVGENTEEPLHVVALDLGIKARTPQQMAERGIKVTVVPRGATLAEILAAKPDGIFFSNGPGDPASSHREVELLRAILDARIPYFGICFGNQLFGRALGLGTYKLPFGHRGVNQPVLDLETGRVEITSHNHGFAVDAPIDGEFIAPYDSGRYGRIQVSHIGLNDQVVEGITALDIPAFSVQYHPEAAAGPHDGEHLFDRFIRLMRQHRPALRAAAEEKGETNA